MSKISRRDFLKVGLAGSSALLAACIPQPAGRVVPVRPVVGGRD
jgi:anaerobic selenocysteine-containing dehydrogenase